MTSPAASRAARFAELVRFYQASLVNTAFGYGFYGLLIWLGMNMFAAQLVAHVTGTAFNYVTHSRHSFRASHPSKLRFAIAYVVFYLMSAGLLALYALVIHSPFYAGACAALTASILNYFALKKLVFARRLVEP